MKKGFVDKRLFLLTAVAMIFFFSLNINVDAATITITCYDIESGAPTTRSSTIGTPVCLAGTTSTPPLPACPSGVTNAKYYRYVSGAVGFMAPSCGCDRDFYENDCDIGDIPSDGEREPAGYECYDNFLREDDSPDSHKLQVVACTPPVTPGVCSTTAHLCNPGTPVTPFTDTATDYKWTCAGLNGGATSQQCSLPKAFASSSPLTFGAGVTEKIRLWESGAVHYGIGIKGGEFVFYKDPGAKYSFYDGNYAANDPVMTILGDGNVGIGTIDPKQKFHVAGSIRVGDYGGIGLTDGNGRINLYSSAFTNTYLQSEAASRITLHTDGIKFYTAPAGTADAAVTWTERVRIANTGNVGIGKNPAYKLDVAGAVGATDFLYTSDVKLKENIKPLEGSLNKILQLQGVSFNWKNNGVGNIGLIAQDVENVYPELVQTSSDGIKSVEYGNLVAPLIESVKEQNRRVDEQQKQIDELKREIERLKNDERWL